MNHVIQVLCTVCALGVCAGGQAGAQESFPQDWSQGDIAFKKAMASDLSFGSGEGRTQPGAIAAWDQFLARDDISPEQRLFATWRIGSLCSTILDPVVRKEKPDQARAEKALAEARDMIPDLICREKLNAVTLHATAPGTNTDRACWLTQGYRWIRSIAQETVEASASRVSGSGFCVGQEFYGAAPESRPASIEQRRQLLERRVKDAGDTLATRIAEFVRWDTDGWAATGLLKAVADVAPPEHLAMWRKAAKEAKLEGDFGDLDKPLLEPLPSEAPKEAPPADTVVPFEVEEDASPAIAVSPDADAGGSGSWKVVIGLSILLLVTGMVLVLLTLRRRESMDPAAGEPPDRYSV